MLYGKMYWLNLHCMTSLPVLFYVCMEGAFNCCVFNFAWLYLVLRVKRPSQSDTSHSQRNSGIQECLVAIGY